MVKRWTESLSRFSNDGWVEHDAMEIYSTQMAVAQEGAAQG